MAAEIEVKKSNHQANVVRIAEILPHPDPDTTNLELIVIGGYQVVVRKGEFHVGDRGVYIQPDSVVPQTEPFRFIWNEYVGLDGKVPEKRRRITVRKFRGQYSEGLLLSVNDFPELFEPVDGGGHEWKLQYEEGSDVSDILGITHYDPDAGVESTRGDVVSNAPKRKFRYPKSFRGWVNFILRWFRNPVAATRDVPFTIPTYDVEAFKNYKGTFIKGENVVVTEKIHGSNARFIYLDGEMYAGSRSQWKAKGGNDVWNKALAENPWIENWCRTHEGYALYGEVTPTQKGFDYGSKKVQFFVFDIRTPEGVWTDYAIYGSSGDLDELVLDHLVPALYVGPFDVEVIDHLVDGPSLIQGAGHIREGIVIKPTFERHVRGLGRAQLKVVSNKFLEKDSK